jgi:hypothetical protein
MKDGQCGGGFGCRRERALRAQVDRSHRLDGLAGLYERSSAPQHVANRTAARPGRGDREAGGHCPHVLSVGPENTDEATAWDVS